ncbi:hypothetical protein M8C21_028746, partial [Ambrosia artemisiifolia]
CWTIVWLGAFTDVETKEEWRGLNEDLSSCVVRDRPDSWPWSAKKDGSFSMEDDPFDFESDILLATSPVVAPKRNCIVRCKYMTQLGDEDDVSHWGLHVFGKQKTPPSLVFSELSSCSLLHSCVNHEVNSLVELSTESGEAFFEVLYSSKEILRSAAVDFWCAILLLKNEGESPSIKIDWLPGYSGLKAALETYGFLFHSPTEDSLDTEMIRKARMMVSCSEALLVEDGEEVIRQLTLINLKDKSCDLFKIYIYLVLTENWFLYNPLLEDNQLLNEMWGLFLRNCSCQINITDSRSYAPKVRSKASYLLQGTTDRLL